MSAPRTNTSIRSAVPARRSGRRRKRARGAALTLARTVTISLGVLAIVIPLAFAFAWSRAKAEPAWWAAASTLDDPDAPRTARLLEQGVTTALHTQRPDGEPWFVRVRDDELNAWLQHRLAMWLENRGAAPASGAAQPRVLISESRLTLGVPSFNAQDQSVLTISLTPLIDEHANLRAADRSFRMGRLPLPEGLIARFMYPSVRDEATDPLARALLLPGGAAPAQVTLSDGRRVRLLGAELNGDGTMVLKLVTDAPQGHAE